MALCAVSSGAALLYEVTWQRALTRYVGVEPGPATVFALILLVAVSAGVAAGGRFTRVAPARLPVLLAVLEGGIAVCGIGSLPLIGRVGAAADGSLAVTVVVTSAVLVVPAFLVGATIPVLVRWLALADRETVGAASRVYGASALGAAAACILSVDVLFAFTGLRGATWCAVAANVAVALVALWIGVRRASPEALRA
jgi:spermidine synthase